MGLLLVLPRVATQRHRSRRPSNSVSAFQSSNSVVHLNIMARRPKMSSSSLAYRRRRRDAICRTLQEDRSVLCRVHWLETPGPGRGIWSVWAIAHNLALAQS